MLDRRLEDIRSEDIDLLIETGASENARLEFKRQLNIEHKADKLEFAKDVCAFANADGGDIIYGIEEGEGKTELEGIAVSVVPFDGVGQDTLKMQLRQILERYIEPHIHGVDFQFVKMDGGVVLVVRVPRSFLGPHSRYNDQDNKERRFPFRNGEYTSDMSYEQLRTAFDRTSTLVARVREFRDKRLALIRSGKGMPKLSDAPYMVLHLVPYVSQEGRTSLDIADLIERQDVSFPDYLVGPEKTPNMDGFFQIYIRRGRRDQETGQPLEYVEAIGQVFRNGSLEIIRDLRPDTPSRRDQSPIAKVSVLVRDLFENQLVLIKNFGLLGPATLSLSLLNVKDKLFWKQNSVSQDHLDFPEHYIEDVAHVNDIDTIVRPLLDMVWQAFGVVRCPYYDPDGQWIAPQ